MKKTISLLLLILVWISSNAENGKIPNENVKIKAQLHFSSYSGIRGIAEMRENKFIFTPSPHNYDYKFLNNIFQIGRAHV